MNDGLKGKDVDDCLTDCSIEAAEYLACRYIARLRLTSASGGAREANRVGAVVKQPRRC